MTFNLQHVHFHGVRVVMAAARGECHDGREHGLPSPPDLAAATIRMGRHRKFGTELPRKAFGIAFDIDGVLFRCSETIRRAPDALRRLYKDVQKGEHLVPKILLTNGGGSTEAARATELEAQVANFQFL